MLLVLAVVGSLYLKYCTLIDLGSAMEEADSQDISQDTPADDVFIAPSIHENEILQGISYTHHAPIPRLIQSELSRECVLGVDEAGRGPVLGTDLHYTHEAQLMT